VPVNVMAVIKQQPEDFYAGPTSDIWLLLPELRKKLFFLLLLPRWFIKR
jgi:hypothetical protein